MTVQWHESKSYQIPGDIGLDVAEECCNGIGLETVRTRCPEELCIFSWYLVISLKCLQNSSSELYTPSAILTARNTIALIILHE